MTDAATAAAATSIVVQPFVQVMLTASLAFTMLTIAVGLKPHDFQFVRTHPRSVLIGFFTQIVGLPLVTLLLILLMSIPPSLALGMIIVACCPGGAMSNLITRIAGGDTAYSVSLTMLSTLFSGLLLPVAILFWASLHAPADALIDEVNIDRTDFVFRTALVLIIPLSTGLLISHFRPALADLLHRRFMPVALLILVFLIVNGLISNRHILAEFGAIMVPLVIVHNAAAFATGAIVGRFFLSDRRKGRALIFEVGIQNAGLGLIIVLAELSAFGEAAILVGTWSLWHLMAGFILAAAFRRFDLRARPEPATNK